MKRKERSKRRLVPTLTFYYAVDGECECEQWYLDWLKRLINTDPRCARKVQFVSRKTSPADYIKKFNDPGPLTAFCLMDREGHDHGQTQHFERALRELSEANKLRAGIQMELGYSNPSFEIWILLRKEAYSGKAQFCRHLLGPINHAFGTNFESLKQMKEERNFKQLLAGCRLDDVLQAIERAR